MADFLLIENAMRYVWLLVVILALGCGRPGLSSVGGGDDDDDSTTPSPTSPPAWALSFDGQDDFVEVARNQAFDVDSITLELWVRPDSLNDADIISHSGNGRGFHLEIASQAPRFSIFDSESNQFSVTGPALKVGEWVHIAAAHRDSPSPRHLWLFVNGVLEDETNLGGGDGGIRTFDANIRLGANVGDGGNAFDGTLSDVRISDGARYTADFTTPTQWLTADADAISLWPLNDGPAAQIAADLSATEDGILGPNTSADPEDPTWIGVEDPADRLP